MVNENKPIGIPYNPNIEPQLVDKANQPYQGLNILLLPEIDLVIPEETKEFYRHWEEFILRGNVNLFEVSLLHTPSQDRTKRMHGYS